MLHVDTNCFVSDFHDPALDFRPHRLLEFRPQAGTLFFQIAFRFIEGHGAALVPKMNLESCLESFVQLHPVDETDCDQSHERFLVSRESASACVLVTVVVRESWQRIESDLRKRGGGSRKVTGFC